MSNTTRKFMILLESSGESIAKKLARLQAQPLTLTATTTGAATVTFAGITVKTGRTLVVSWGDGSADDTYTAGAGARTHNYAGAGTWTVTLTNRQDMSLLNISDAKVGGTINANNPMPTGLTNLTLTGLTGLTWTVSATAPMPTGLTNLTLASLPGLTWTVGADAPMPTGLTTLYLITLPGLTWTVSATAPMPTGLTTLYLSTLAGLTWEIRSGYAWPTGATAMAVLACPSVTCTAWTDNAIRTIQAENAYSAAAVDAFLLALLANKANFTYATPTADFLGGSNAAPSGTYQTANPATTGKEYAYALVNGQDPPYAAGPEWVVATA